MRILGSLFLLWLLPPGLVAFTPPETDPAHGAAITELSPAVKKRLQTACFEVVIPKPEKDSLTYERELPWEQLPFHVRNDKYISIGTAFAVSATELLTAFHVLELGQELLSFPRYFIRDAEQRVFEIDRVLSAHEHRDVVRFTVRGRSFSQWFELEPRYELNRPVFTAGNAYGEGVVVRRGELLGTHPEPMDGAFSWLKSSADVNSGNSGGPLLDRRGRAIGLVVVRKDNLCYSLPAADILALAPDRAVFYTKIMYGFDLFPEKSKLAPSRFEIPLPLDYRELKRRARQTRQDEYVQGMAALFAAQKECFPEGAASAEVIHRVPTSPFLELVYKDQNSNRWDLSDVEVKKFDLGDNGQLRVAKAADLLLLGIRKPDSLTYADLVGKPRAAMDLVFRGLHIPREIGSEKVRITSLGEPIRAFDLRDRWGRPWRVAIWHMEFNDRAVFLLSTPVPSGLLGVLEETPSASLDNWIVDLRKIVDHLHVPYAGRIREWQSFLQLPAEHLPESFRGLRLEVDPGKTLALRTPWVELELDRRRASLSVDDNLNLYMGFERREAGVAWTLRRLVYSQDENDDYFVWIRHLKPAPGLDESHAKEWQDIAQGRHPYNREPMIKEGRTDIAMVLNSFLPKGAPPGEAADLCTLYLGRTGTIARGAMRKLLDAVAGALKPVSRDGGRPR